LLDSLWLGEYLKKALDGEIEDGLKILYYEK
jgi:hypothetical protein